ncbi:MAG TPA: hypothetical protein VHZ52_01160 [Acidobacteriaceae bacterium]|nr:hypothetical protein [Acidobacteriaceae bacterium]
MRLSRYVAIAAASLLIGLVATWSVRAALDGADTAPHELAAWLPQGALLTIESKDFAGLLKRWNDSAEKAAWLKSDDFSVFSRSRLFGRLGDAQNEFAQSAGLPPDMSFLNEVAGSESVFAWYDIGKLEFLYITRMPGGAAEKTRLVQMHGKFNTRQLGAQTFYVRTKSDPSQGEARTVAFATSGDWLLLATREDLMASALRLMAAKTASGDSQAAEPWFGDVRRAAAKTPGDLRMTLNLEKIVPTPYFRSYWVQENITELKQYRSAVADLYLNAGSFREERVLLPKAAQESVPAGADLAALTALLPNHSGVYRAVADPDIKTALSTIDEKLLTRLPGSYTDLRVAPDADVAVHEVGTASDLETRIDAAPLVRPAQGSEMELLRQELIAADLQGMMTSGRTGNAEGGLWVPFESAVVLRAAKEWNVPALQSALRQAAGAHLTASGMGLVWKPMKTSAGSYFELSEARPLEMAVAGNLCVLTDDAGLMGEMLERLAAKTQGVGSETQPSGHAHGDALPPNATMVAGFELQPERTSFSRWSALVDRTTNRAMNGATPAAAGLTADGNGNGNEPSFFSQNMRSLGDSFAALESEHMVERKDGPVTRQTVTYAWRR